MTTQIKHRYTYKIIYETEAENIKKAVEEAIKNGISLEFANLEDANLGGVNLEDANLEFANLKGANLEFANLKGANLKGANLKFANLEDAELEGANLEGANTKYCFVNFSPQEYKQARQFIEGLK